MKYANRRHAAVVAAAFVFAAGFLAPSALGAPVHAASGRPGPAGAPLPWHAHHASRLLPGDILIADADNNRMLLVTPGKHIVWQFPKPGQPSPLHDDDDVFFGPHFDEIITNEEAYNQIAIINFRTRRIVWTYGKAGTPGSAPGELHTPDDAFLYARDGGLITVADIVNQRILFIDRRTKAIVRQYGTTGVMRIQPPTYFSAPNGDFPAPHQGMLVTQINGDDAILLSRSGHVVWTVHFPSYVYYPSDANFTPSGNIIAAFYTNPGAVLIMSPQGKVLWRYMVTSGPGRLDHPSLAVQLKNGLVLLTDDGNDRVILIDPHTDRIVWQYGHTGVPGTAPGYLSDPDGLDFLPAGVVPGGHNPIADHLWSYPGNGL